MLGRKHAPERILPASEVARHAWGRVKQLWKSQLAGVVIVAVGTFVVEWASSDFSKKTWHQVTTTALYPTVAVVIWLVLSGAWHLWRAPLQLAREREAGHQAELAAVVKDRDEARALVLRDGTSVGLNSSQRLMIANDPESILVGEIDRDEDGVVLAGDVSWPDGATGRYQAEVDPLWPGGVRAYTVTHVLAGVTTTYEQPPMTRTGVGGVTHRPPLIVS